MRVARRIGPVRAVILLFAAFTAGHALFLLLRSPIEPDAQASAATVLPLFLLPAVIAIIGLVRGSMPLVGAAGALSSFPTIMTGWPVIAFAGFLAIAGLARGPSPSGGELLRGLAVAILGMAIWIVPYIGVSPWDPIEGSRLGLGAGMYVATIALAIGRPARPATVRLAR